MAWHRNSALIENGVCLFVSLHEYEFESEYEVNMRNAEEEEEEEITKK